MPSIHLADGRRVPYRIRVSPRSRRVRLTLNPRDGLVMVTPPGVDRGRRAGQCQPARPHRAGRHRGADSAYWTYTTHSIVQVAIAMALAHLP